MKNKNHTVLFFFIKLIALTIIWLVGYHYVLKPTRIPDKILTDIITSIVTFCMNLHNNTAHYTWTDYASLSSAYIMKGGKAVFIIADQCNALDLLVIYLGFIIVLPFQLKRKLIFSFAGIIAIMLANVVRCLCLYWISLKHPSWFYISHHYVFSILMYLYIFLGWLLFIRKGKTYAIG
ncbi:exosortase/archaeosortase family protein [Ferruginibacter albus]|uniref:exosortase/archaeosortase family protein n=1 Tax=Ferruginibacter albus TaxID=2875540 RepID=UPI001CC7F2C2|nr:exosortase/archaeosortase family protein [Ferruginibacter albus]UAY51959.1 exosortase/archaeosortase family protein [Ferruginibacter albus]